VKGERQYLAEPVVFTQAGHGAERDLILVVDAQGHVAAHADQVSAQVFVNLDMPHAADIRFAKKTVADIDLGMMPARMFNDIVCMLGFNNKLRSQRRVFGDIEQEKIARPPFVDIRVASKLITNRRPQLAEALRACRKHKATLIIAKLDRLARNVAFISNLMEAGVDFVAADMPHANRLTVHILAAVAEHEREMISQRTKVALAAAKARGTRLGNPRPGKAVKLGGAATQAKADQFAANVRPIIEDIKRAGVESWNGIAKALNARGVKAARGGGWSARTVANILARG